MGTVCGKDDAATDLLSASKDVVQTQPVVTTPAEGDTEADSKPQESKQSSAEHKETETLHEAGIDNRTYAQVVQTTTAKAPSETNTEKEQQRVEEHKEEEEEEKKQPQQHYEEEEKVPESKSSSIPASQQQLPQHTEKELQSEGETSAAVSKTEDEMTSVQDIAASPVAPVPVAATSSSSSPSPSPSPSPVPFPSSSPSPSAPPLCVSSDVPVPAGSKRCISCQSIKSKKDGFSKSQGQKKDGKCKDCIEKAEKA